MSNEDVSVLTETVVLPSRGLIYPPEMGVPESLTIKPFKVKDLKGLFGSNSLDAFNALIKNCINENIKFDVRDLHGNDKSVLYIRMRAITLGSNYTAIKKCGGCKASFEVRWNLDDIVVDYLDLDEYPVKVVLPDSEKQISIGVNLPKDLKDIQDYISRKKNLIKKDNFDEAAEANFSFYASCIKNIDGVIPSLETRNEFLLSCTPDDFGYIQQVVNALVGFGANIEKVVKCPQCGAEHKVEINQTEEFFRRTHELPAGIRIQKKIIKSMENKAV